MKTSMGNFRKRGEALRLYLFIIPFFVPTFNVQKKNGQERWLNFKIPFFKLIHLSVSV